jgi:hypothetical protein
MINKINKERRRSMNAAPTRSSNKSQWQEAQEDPNQKQDRAQERPCAGKSQKNIHKKKKLVTDKELKENK